MRKISIKIIIIIILLVFFVVFLVNLFIETGIFQKSRIDSRDLSYWKYDSEGFIKEAREFSILGNNETCWILIHSYAATPKEMKELALSINREMNDTVIVPLLEGHSQVPSRLIGKNLDVWYSQITELYDRTLLSCQKINVAGSSLSSSLALRLAEERSLNKVFVLNSFIYLPYKPYRILPLRAYINILTPLVHYNKKKELAQINDAENIKQHIAYWNMPYPPIKQSFSFIDKTVENLRSIDEPIFIAHSRKDPTAGKKSAIIVYENVNSTSRELKWYDHSSHVLLIDSDREYLIIDILEFARQ